MSVPITSPWDGSLEGYNQITLKWPGENKDYLVFFIKPEDDSSEVPIYLGSSKNMGDRVRSIDILIEPRMPGVPVKELHKGKLSIFQKYPGFSYRYGLRLDPENPEISATGTEIQISAYDIKEINTGQIISVTPSSNIEVELAQ